MIVNAAEVSAAYKGHLKVVQGSDWLIEQRWKGTIDLY